MRVSGPAVRDIACEILGALPCPRRAELHAFRDGSGDAIDRGIALLMEGPASYTGEDVLELQGHGGPVVLDALLARIVELGARLARPGEFTERAFLNDRLDLVQAEAVADLIDAGSEAAARAARRSLDGALSRAVEALAAELAELRAWVEATIDFPDEEVDHLADVELRDRAARLADAMEALRRRVRHGVLLRDGLNVTIAGRPNVGKSSLLNRLSGRDAAIVTTVPGTTRDLLRERFALRGVAVELVDTAGLRESDDEVERIGIARAWEAIERADAVLLVCEDMPGPGEWEQGVLARVGDERPVLLVRNKIDLHGGAPGRGEWQGVPALAVSVRADTGMDALANALVRAVAEIPEDGGELSARRRHLESLDAAAACIARAIERVEEGQGDLAAEDLRAAEGALGDIVGARSTEDLLERIFSSFCIGK